MNATAQRPAFPQLQMSPFWRVGAALVVLCLVALAWTSAEHASRERVQTAKAEISRSATHIQLPRVEVIVRRDASGRDI